jgi:hypothetical protein
MSYGYVVGCGPVAICKLRDTNILALLELQPSSYKTKIERVQSINKY